MCESHASILYKKYIYIYIKTCVCVCVCVLPAAPREEAKKKRGRREFWALGKLIVCHAWELGP